MIFIYSYTFYFCTFDFLGRVLHLQIYPLQSLGKIRFNTPSYVLLLSHSQGTKATVNLTLQEALQTPLKPGGEKKKKKRTRTIFVFSIPVLGDVCPSLILLTQVKMYLFCKILLSDDATILYITFSFLFPKCLK